MNRKFSPEVKKIISKSRDEAARLGNHYIGSEHLMLSLIQNKDNMIELLGDAYDVALEPEKSTSQ